MLDSNNMICCDNCCNAIVEINENIESGKVSSKYVSNKYEAFASNSMISSESEVVLTPNKYYRVITNKDGKFNNMDVCEICLDYIIKDFISNKNFDEISIVKEEIK